MNQNYLQNDGGYHWNLNDYMENKEGYHYNIQREFLKDILIKIDEEAKKKEQDEKFPWITIPGKQEKPCLHKQCAQCHGTGRKENGQLCIHMISCPCKSCNPYYL